MSKKGILIATAVAATMALGGCDRPWDHPQGYQPAPGAQSSAKMAPAPPPRRTRSGKLGGNSCKGKNGCKGNSCKGNSCKGKR